jgi:hypothetical protein
MSTIDMADLQRRVDENVAALYAGEDLPHQFTEEESLALRPKRSHGFGIQPDGEIMHCGTALMDKSRLQIALWNDTMRIEAGFLPHMTPEEIREMRRSEMEHQQKEQADSALWASNVEVVLFRAKVVLLAIALAALWWFFVR